MSFLSKTFGLDDLTAAVRESNSRLDAATQSLKAGGEKSDARLQTLTTAVQESNGHLDTAAQSLKASGEENGARFQALTTAVRESNGHLDAAAQSLKTGGEKSDSHLQSLTTAVRESNNHLVVATQSVKAGADESNARLQAIAQTLVERETPEMIQRAVGSALQNSELPNALVVTRKQLEAVDASIKNAAVRPIPVQTFPVVDDIRFEKEKQQTALVAAKQFVTVGTEFIDKLNSAHRPVDEKLKKFFSLIDQHVKIGAKKDDEAKDEAVVKKDDVDKGAVLKQAMNELLDCSPKRVIAGFQKYSLQAGVAFVQDFNRVIDELARQYPRCRAGIYASRLNYSDVIQISEETLATLRATSTMLDDVQRRYDLLEALQGELVNDLQSHEISQIFEAIKGSFSDTFNGIVDKDDSLWSKMWKAPIGVAGGALAWAMAVIAAPQAQFQGQLARVHRVKVFVATSILLRHGWAEWSRTNEDVVVPNLKVMFALKCDYVANRVLSITDVISTNGYTLEQLPMKIESILTKKA